MGCGVECNESRVRVRRTWLRSQPQCCGLYPSRLLLTLSLPVTGQNPNAFIPCHSMVQLLSWLYTGVTWGTLKNANVWDPPTENLICWEESLGTTRICKIIPGTLICTSVRNMLCAIPKDGSVQVTPTSIPLQLGRSCPAMGMVPLKPHF